MQIHELNNFNGTPGASDYLATDNGVDTSKISIKAITDPLNARIDNIIAGPASSAQEVIDARLGADGVTYGSLGAAIRTQFSDVKSALTAINADISYTIEAGIYNASGEKGSASAYWLEQRTTKINVENIKNIKWSFDCDTSVTQEGIWSYTWTKNGSFIERTQLVGQSVFTHADGVISIGDTVGLIAFCFGTRGYTVNFNLVANYNIEKYVGEINTLDETVSPKPTYTIDDGYYDGTTGVERSPSSYWKEKLTTKICVDNIKVVNWVFECTDLLSQGGISIAKWAKDGSFIERSTVQSAGTYSKASGAYQVESGVWWVAFNYSTRGYTCTFTINDGIDYLAVTEDVTALKSKLDGTDIIAGNQDALTKIMASRWMEDDTALPVSLLWFTDPHRKEEPLERIIKFKKHLESLSMLDDTICTGDIVLSSSEETTQFAKYWTDNPNTSDILIACGNHEWYANTSQPHTKMTIAQIDAMYFSNTSEWDIVRSGTNPFYYKDYTDQKIRLVVVDPAVTDEEADETSWLDSVLADAITNEYAVVIATHFLRGNLTIYDNYWTEVDKRDLEVFTQGYDWTGCDIIACVTEFISNGGTFICYMQGHTHRDFLGYPQGHPEQLVVSLASASWGRSETPLRMNDLPRYAGTRTEDCFNLISVDSNRGLLKCVRIGSNINLLEEPRTAFSYNYLTHEFISLI